MRIILILSIMIMTAQAFTENISKQCEIAMTEATKVHWKYVLGEVSLNKTYNVTNVMKKKCKKG